MRLDWGERVRLRVLPTTTGEGACAPRAIASFRKANNELPFSIRCKSPGRPLIQS
jgi:hypothetical protein